MMNLFVSDYISLYYGELCFDFSFSLFFFVTNAIVLVNLGGRGEPFLFGHSVADCL